MDTREELVKLEQRFWQSLVEQDAEAALSMLEDPALLVTAHGVTRVNHATYQELLEKGNTVLKHYRLGPVDVAFPCDDVAVLTYMVRQTTEPRGKLLPTTQDMADTSMWVRRDGGWRCVMHTETEVD